jgi:opacity protein-like surface antigen
MNQSSGGGGPSRPSPSIVRVLFGSLFVSVGAWTVSAEETAASPSPNPRFEVTPFVGYRLGEGFGIEGSDEDVNVHDHGSHAIALGYRGEELLYELFYSRQPTRIDSSASLEESDMDIEYLHFGASQAFDTEPLNPYILGAVGVTRLSLDTQGVQDSTHFSLSIAAGLRVPLKERLDLRLEGRGYLTFFSSDSSIFCASTSAGGGCALQRSGAVFMQFELFAGAAFSF